MSAATSLLESQVAESEEKLSASLTELAAVARAKVDVGAQVRNHPLVGFGLAMAAGVAAGAVMGASRRRRVSAATGDAHRSIDRVARPRMWEPAAQAVMGIAATQVARVSQDLLRVVMDRYLRAK